MDPEDVTAAGAMSEGVTPPPAVSHVPPPVANSSSGSHLAPPYRVKTTDNYIWRVESVADGWIHPAIFHDAANAQELADQLNEDAQRMTS